MGQINSINDVNYSPIEFYVDVNMTSSATNNTFRYRAFLYVSEGYSGHSYVSGYYSTNQATTFNLPRFVVGGDGYITPGVTYSCRLTIQYYDTGASNPSWQDSALIRDFSHTMPTADMIASAQAITDTSAVIRSGLQTNCYNSDVYYLAQIEYGNATVYSQEKHIYSTGSLYDYFNNVTLTGLTPNTTYNVTVEIKYGSSRSNALNSRYVKWTSFSFTTTQSGSPDPPEGTIANVTTAPSTTTTDLSWRWTPDQEFRTSGYVYSWRVIYSTDQSLSSYYYKESSQDISGSTTPINLYTTLTGLAANLTYYYKITMYGAASGENQSSIATYRNHFTTPPNTEILLQWSWSKAAYSWNDDESSNSAEMLSAAYNAVTNGGETTDFSYLIWNDLIAWIVFNLDSLGTSYSQQTVSNAQMSSNDKTLTALRWNNFASLCNTLLSAIGSNSRISTYSQGDNVYGSIFTSTVNTVNSAINSY